MDFTSISTLFSNGNYSNRATNSTTVYKEISQVQFNPFLKIYLGDTVRMWYLKLGFLVGCFGKTSVEYDETSIYEYTLNGPPPYKDTTVTVIIHTITDYKNGISYGFTSGLGREFSISDKVLLLTEFDFNFMKWKPKKIQELL